MLKILYDQDYVTECYEKELYDEGIQQGIQTGIQQGIQTGIQRGINVIEDLLKEGLISKKEAKKRIASMQ